MQEESTVQQMKKKSEAERVPPKPDEFGSAIVPEGSDREDRVARSRPQECNVALGLHCFRRGP